MKTLTDCSIPEEMGCRGACFSGFFMDRGTGSRGIIAGTGVLSTLKNKDPGQRSEFSGAVSGFYLFAGQLSSWEMASIRVVCSAETASSRL